MSWQKCPVCDGQGYVYNIGTATEISKACPTCGGKRIISEFTGKPPSEEAEPIEKERLGKFLEYVAR